MCFVFDCVPITYCLIMVAGEPLQTELSSRYAVNLRKKIEVIPDMYRSLGNAMFGSRSEISH